jgi:hypothetical protein
MVSGAGGGAGADANDAAGGYGLYIDCISRWCSCGGDGAREEYNSEGDDGGANTGDGGGGSSGKQTQYQYDGGAGGSGVVVIRIISTHVYPGKASSPDPEDEAVEVELDKTLGWDAADDATSYRIYFGEEGSMVFKTEQSGRTYDPGDLDVNTEYEWRIDPKNDVGTTTGDTWGFTTIPLPLPAVDPNPINNAYGVEADATFSWTDGGTGDGVATNYQVFVDGESVGYTNVASFDPDGLEEFSEYEWQVASYNEYGGVTGSVWRFSTTGQPVRRRTCGVPGGWIVDGVRGWIFGN